MAEPAATEAEDNAETCRFVAGIDLGTTNSAITFVDTIQVPRRVRVCAVPQLVAAGLVESRETLPSFHYEAAANEFPTHALDLPWQTAAATAVGVFAREQGRLVPGRVIDSAKSWLCHTGVDRTDDLLPWHGAADVARLSPVEVSSRYLAHLKAAWDHRFPDHPLAEQDIILTLPASFDEVARELTVQAARQAGLPRVVLIEEPQAAFYAWIDHHENTWEQNVSPGQKILVADIGGGTSDFTLIRVRKGAGEKIQFHRVAVGEHLILGGDNLDLALAHHLERKLKGEGKLEPRQWSVLVQTCRHVKETLLGADAPERMTVNLPGSGSRLIGGGLQVEITREQALEVLVEGFLPRVSLEEKPQVRRSGFQEFGTALRHRCRHHPLSGRVFDGSPQRDRGRRRTAQRPRSRPPGHRAVQRRLFRFTGSQGTLAGSAVLLVLDKNRTELAAVGIKERPLGSRGFARGCLLRDGSAGRRRSHRGGFGENVLHRRGGDGKPSHLPDARRHGTRPGFGNHRSQVFAQGFRADRVSALRFQHAVDRSRGRVGGDRSRTNAGLAAAANRVENSQKKRRRAGFRSYLNARLTEIGTLELWCREVEGNRSWRLQFDIRSRHANRHRRPRIRRRARRRVGRGRLAANLGDYRRRVREVGQGKTLGTGETHCRGHRPEPIRMAFFPAEKYLGSLDGPRSGPTKIADHEARWLNLLGFSLRPGYGLALDDWRVAETWKILNGKLVHGVPNCRAEWWILWRRIGGGLLAGQQTALASPLLAPIRQIHKQMTTGRGKGGTGLSSNTHEQAEIWRMLGSLERLNMTVKQELGRMILDLYGRPKMEAVRFAMIWALGRLGARKPLYGPLNGVIPPQEAAGWVKRLMEDAFEDSMLPLAIMQIARRTEDRFRDLSSETRRQCVSWLDLHQAPAHFQNLVQTAGTLETEEQSLIFGESLPKGLRIL